jgi:hypothetical protein
MAVGLGIINYQHINCLEERVKTLNDYQGLAEVGSSGRRYVTKFHGARLIAEKLGKIWREASA